MRCVRFFYAVLTAIPVLFLYCESAYAGCPAFPPEARRITVAECRFYDAAQDQDLRAKVDRHFADWPDAASPAQILSYKNAVYARNTGAIVTALSPDGGNRFELFHQSASPDVCAAYPAGETQTVFTVRTCVMVFFAAPTELVIVPEPEKQGDSRTSRQQPEAEQ